MTARVVMSTIEATAKTKDGIPDRADVLAALTDIKLQGIAYAAPEASTPRAARSRLSSS
jgi:hypothetical protein